MRRRIVACNECSIQRGPIPDGDGWRDALLLLLLSTLPLVAGPLATNDATSTLITRSMANIDVREREEICNLQYCTRCDTE